MLLEKSSPVFLAAFVFLSGCATNCSPVILDQEIVEVHFTMHYPESSSKDSCLGVTERVFRFSDFYDAQGVEVHIPPVGYIIKPEVPCEVDSRTFNAAIVPIDFP
jgi:hypothetical protein